MFGKSLRLFESIGIVISNSTYRSLLCAVYRVLVYPTPTSCLERFSVTFHSEVKHLLRTRTDGVGTKPLVFRNPLFAGGLS